MNLEAGGMDGSSGANETDSPVSQRRADELPAPPPERQEVLLRREVKRLDWSLLGDATLGFFSMETTFTRTLRDFVVNPRRAFESYLGPARLQFSNPLKLLITLVAISTFLNYLVGNFDAVVDGWAMGAQEAGTEQTLTLEQQAALSAFLQRYYNLLVLGGLPVVAFITRFVYWNRAYNVVEHLALNSFALSVTTSFYILLVGPAIKFPLVMALYGMGSLGYQTWVYRRVMGPGWFRALAATTLSTLSSMMIFIAALGLYVAYLQA
ncbi:hypothetical protein [Actomonas aquatica]|uniref:DUF3667 domain-containing protein n=1 Tax=Actomonas aquatica TaxID=2866162 RepID=A0ABZ1C3D2_9BACT|nr:hypothetical protein [Opitutus sp. WL0086]WRQ86001.1 hypothetical protein K1X11_014400 [Opitutus sp. WL0086]